MACTPSATETLFDTLTSTTVLTTFSASVQTLSASQSTFISSSCLSSVSGICAAPTAIAEVTNIPGAVTTIQIPILATNTGTNVIPTLTLFASCSSTAPQITPTGDEQPSASPSPTSQSTSSFVTTSFLTTTTPPPTVVTQQAQTTLDNGSVSVANSTSTSQQSASAVYLPTTAPVGQASILPQQTNNSGSSSNLAPILGGVVGGFVSLVAVVLIIWIVYRRSLRRRRDIDDEDVIPYPVTRVKDHRRQLDLANEPKPYQYGLVGHTPSESSMLTPPSTPPASVSLNHYSRSSTLLHVRADSTTPLMSSSYLSPGPSSPPPDMLSQSSSSLPLSSRQRRSSHVDNLGGRPPSVTMANRNTRRHSAGSAARLSLATTPTDYFGPISEGVGNGRPQGQDVLLPLNTERRELQIVNAPLSPTSVHRQHSDTSRTSPHAGPSFTPLATLNADVPPSLPKRSSRRVRRESSSSSVIVHTDGGRVPDDRISTTPSSVPATLPTVVDEFPPPAFTT